MLRLAGDEGVDGAQGDGAGDRGGGIFAIAFPPSNTGPVYERMVAELNEQAIQYQSEAEAEVNRILSEGQKTAEQTRADVRSMPRRSVARGMPKRCGIRRKRGREQDALGAGILSVLEKSGLSQDVAGEEPILRWLRRTARFAAVCFCRRQLAEFTPPEPAGAAAGQAAISGAPRQYVPAAVARRLCRGRRSNCRFAAQR